MSPIFSLVEQVHSNRHGAMAVGAALVAAVPAVTLLSDDEDSATPPAYPWRHTGYFSSFHCGALRRGFQVYREVCSTCHSLEYIRWRELVGVTHTKDEVKAMAKEVDIEDGPNSEGEMFERPSKLPDVLPRPYKNEKQGEAANGGAYPPDLSLMVLARFNGHDYIMALLTGYMDPPSGREMVPGVYYNPYFPGGGIAMPPPLQDEGVEYPDGTVATISQQARDVAQFLHWTAQPETEERKKGAALHLTAMVFMALGAGYSKRVYWSSLKTRKIAYVKGM